MSGWRGGRRGRLAAVLLGAAAALGICVSGGGAPAQGSPPPLGRLEEVLSIGGPEADTLFQWTGVAVDEDAAIYVLDAMDFALKKFDPSGRLLRSRGRQGKGPGEFSAPRLLEYGDGILYVADQGAPALQLFDRELDFRGTIRTPGIVTAIEALPRGRIAVVPFTSAGPSRVLVLDREGAIERSLTYLEKPAGLLMDSVSLASDGAGGFYLAFFSQDLIERRDAQGKRAWSRSFFGARPPKTREIEGFRLPDESYFKDVAVDHRGRIYVLLGRSGRHPGRDVYVLGPDGRRLADLVLPATSHCLYLDGRDFLYSRADDGLTLKKFRVVLPE